MAVLTSDKDNFYYQYYQFITKTATSNVYVSNNRSSKYIEQNWVEQQGEGKKYTTRDGDLKILLLIINRINGYTQGMKHTSFNRIIVLFKYT